MLPFPDRVAAFLDRVAPSIPCTLSIKTRLGRQSPEEIFRLMPVFNRYPLSELIIHPRTGGQMYAGHPDLETFSACLAESAHPVAYNGDICSLNALKRLKARFPAVRSWMIGRGALADPFLAEHLKAGSEKIPPDLNRFRAFQEDLFHSSDAVLSGPAHTVDRMKGFWYYFSRSFPESKRDIKKILRAKTPDGYRGAVSAFFETDPPWRPAALESTTGGFFENTD
jgi:tRNA-dihydrouridine synthase